MNNTLQYLEVIHILNIRILHKKIYEFLLSPFITFNHYEYIKITHHYKKKKSLKLKKYHLAITSPYCTGLTKAYSFIFS